MTTEHTVESSCPPPKSLAVILGSAFSSKPPQSLELVPIFVETPWGKVCLYQVKNTLNVHQAYLIFRHGLPHQTLPHLINFRAYAAALKKLNCSALLITSSVGVLDDRIPLNQALLVSNLLMPENRLPNGELCTMFDGKSDQHASIKGTLLHSALKPGHLVLDSGLFSQPLNQQVKELLNEIEKLRQSPTRHIKEQNDLDLTFAYAPGPRTKTSAENRYWQSMGAHINSMSVGPELVLANELEMPCSVVVVGHKYSSSTESQKALATDSTPCSSKEELNHRQYEAEKNEMTMTLERSHQELEQLVLKFVQKAIPVSFDNYIYRFT